MKVSTVDSDPGLDAGILESPLYLVDLVNVSNRLLLEVCESVPLPISKNVRRDDTRGQHRNFRNGTLFDEHAV